MEILERIENLQKLMIEKNIDTYVLTKFDPHQSEDGGDYYHLPKYFSGFSGSNAKLVITKTDRFIFTDGRYYKQCELETKKNGFTLVKESEEDSIPFLDFAIENTKENGTIAILPETLSVSAIKDFLTNLPSKNIKLLTNDLSVNEIWKDRSFAKVKNIFELDIKYAGEKRIEKIEKVLTILNKKNIPNYILSSLDDIAYVLNLRGFDIDYNTFFASYLIFENGKVTLFVALDKISDVKNSLEADNIIIKDYSQFFSYIETMEKNSKTLININKTCYEILLKGASLNFIEEKIDLTENLKALKNEIEIENIKVSSNRDNSALVRAFRKIKENANNLTEYDVNKILLEEREKNDLLIRESFHPICAYMENAAMPHYHATALDNTKLKAEGILLIDSGGTYFDGTTDITRTIALGEVTDEIKTDFTLVLKSHIAIATAKFLSGATGAKIDTIARIPMWNVGRNYNHGTGHGIAFVGPVHEGPQSMGFKDNGVPLKENMILSNEPGLYVDNNFGIRTENTIRVIPFIETKDGKFLQFETTSFCPIDIDLINIDMLTPEEINWLNGYHAQTLINLSPYLDGKDLEFLKHSTRNI